jgi:hypothetical protein
MDPGLIRHALVEVVAAWESLPEGYHSSVMVAKWIQGPLKQAIDNAREVLR